MDSRQKRAGMTEGGTLGVWDDRRKGTWNDLDAMGAFLAEPDLIFKDGFEGPP